MTNGHNHYSQHNYHHNHHHNHQYHYTNNSNRGSNSNTSNYRKNSNSNNNNDRNNNSNNNNNNNNSSNQDRHYHNNGQQQQFYSNRGASLHSLNNSNHRINANLNSNYNKYQNVNSNLNSKHPQHSTSYKKKRQSMTNEPNRRANKLNSSDHTHFSEDEAISDCRQEDDVVEESEYEAEDEFGTNKKNQLITGTGQQKNMQQKGFTFACNYQAQYQPAPFQPASSYHASSFNSNRLANGNINTSKSNNNEAASDFYTQNGCNRNSNHTQNHHNQQNHSHHNTHHLNHSHHHHNHHHNHHYGHHGQHHNSLQSQTGNNHHNHNNKNYQANTSSMNSNNNKNNNNSQSSLSNHRVANSNSNKHHLIEKYDRKYNLISFILLRKSEDYMSDAKFYINDQSFYEKIDTLIEGECIKALRELFLNESINPKLLTPQQAESMNSGVDYSRLSNFTNSYNCNLFVYTIRQCLSHMYKLKQTQSNQIASCLIDDNNNKYNNYNSINSTSESNVNSTIWSELIDFMFSDKCKPVSYYLVDGDFPRRNIMHYACKYDYARLATLIRETSYLNEQIKSSDVIQADMTHTAQTTHDINKSDVELIQLCISVDFNGNTPIHLAAMHDSVNTLKQINKLCIRRAQLLYNEDGLNPFLLACRYASVPLIKCIVEACSTPIDNNNGSSVSALVDHNLLTCINRVNSNNALHYACGRGSGDDTLCIVQYLVNFAKTQQSSTESNSNGSTILNELIGGYSPLTGTVYHMAASNLIRLSTLWFLLNLPVPTGYCKFKTPTPPSQQQLAQQALHQQQLNQSISLLDKTDFRKFTCLDCLIDSVINLREMAPANCRSMDLFYNQLMKETQINKQEEKEETNEKKIDSDEIEPPKQEFNILLKKCLYKLLVEHRGNILNVPRIKNQLQLIECLRLVVFISKFGSGFIKVQQLDESISANEIRFNLSSNNAESKVMHQSVPVPIYYESFEQFCINFVNSFLFNGNYLCMFATNVSDNSSNEATSSEKKQQSNLKSKLTTKSLLNELRHVSCGEEPTSPADVHQERSCGAACLKDMENYFEILTLLYELTSIVILSGTHQYTSYFQSKLYSDLNAFYNALDEHLSLCIESCTEQKRSKSSSSFTADEFFDLKMKITSESERNCKEKKEKLINYKLKLREFKIKIEQINSKKHTLTLKNLCRIKVNSCLIKSLQMKSLKYSQSNSPIKSSSADLTNNLHKSCSALNSAYIYFKLPKVYSKLLNFLTFNLIEDLYEKNTNVDSFFQE
jgi:hypothetical protein